MKNEYEEMLDQTFTGYGEERFSWKDLLDFNIISFFILIILSIVFIFEIFIGFGDYVNYNGKIDKIDNYMLNEFDYCLIKIGDVALDKISRKDCFMLDFNKTYNIKYKMINETVTHYKIKEIKNEDRR